jgi:PAS domain-containing protein
MRWQVTTYAIALIASAGVSGVLVLDEKHRILDMNPAVRDLLEVTAVRVGDDLAVALTAWPAVIEACLAAREARSEIRLSGDSPRCLSIRVSALRDRRKRITGRLVVMRDITERKQAEEDRERLIAELQAALANVKTLRGLLPICANCKKVRDDEGYWRGVEEYVMEHSEAHFSHGICPDCMQKLYPWLKLGGQP